VLGCVGDLDGVFGLPSGAFGGLGLGEGGGISGVELGMEGEVGGGGEC
jgi:hypothetical protein